MRSSSITGVWLASDSAKPCSTARTIEGRLGRGSSSHICDFMANAWERSCMMLEPRSEEHTSELQSLRHLVCRLLLEKKIPKQRYYHQQHSPGRSHAVYSLTLPS